MSHIMHHGSTRTAPSRSLDLAEPASLQRLADRIGREFDAPVGLLDPIHETWLAWTGGDSLKPRIDSLHLEPGRVMLDHPQGEDGPVWLSFPAAGFAGKSILAIVGFQPPHASPSPPWGPPCPERALLAWGEAVANRILARSQSAAAPPDPDSARFEPALPDRLIRELSVSDPPARYQRMATAAVQQQLKVEIAAWVPHDPHEPLVSAGEIPGFPVESLRPMVHEYGNQAVWVSNRPAVHWAPAIRNIAILRCGSRIPVGWLVVANTQDRKPIASELETLITIASSIATQRANARTYADLRDLLFGVVRALTSAIDAKDKYTSGHSERVARIAVRLAEELGLSHNQRGDLYLMGLLHDIGKIGIQDSILKKPGKLKPDEFKRVQDHVQIGVTILQDLKKLSHLLPGVAHHHERMDGKGYPDGLTGHDIPLAARILAVADAFDAMSSSRPYRERLAPAEIEAIFRKGAGSQWDPQIIDALFRCRSDLESIRQKGLGASLQKAVHDTLDRHPKGHAGSLAPRPD
jgi:HD-GYP domain-containing protein (c-di-GMP phosphodiesterase class II)